MKSNSVVYNADPPIPVFKLLSFLQPLKSARAGGSVHFVLHWISPKKTFGKHNPLTTSHHLQYMLASNCPQKCNMEAFKPPTQLPTSIISSFSQLVNPQWVTLCLHQPKTNMATKKCNFWSRKHHLCQCHSLEMEAPYLFQKSGSNYGLIWRTLFTVETRVYPQNL